MTQTAQEIRGKHVVALEEGRDMGRISKVYFNPKKKRISGLAVKESRLRGDEKWVKAEDIEQVGDDFVFISESKACRAVKPKGRSLKDLTGLEVTTLEGKKLGVLEDVEVGEGWDITELNLSGKKSLQINSRSDVFGEDAILVRSDAETRLNKNTGSENRGLLSRMFIGDSPGTEKSEGKRRAQTRSRTGKRKSRK